MSTTSEDCEFVCNRCDATFETEDKLLRHRRHNKKRPCDFVCYDCGRQLGSKSSYDKHIRSNCKYNPKPRGKYAKPKRDLAGAKVAVISNSDNAVSNQSTAMNSNVKSVTNNVNINIEPLILLADSGVSILNKQAVVYEIVKKVVPIITNSKYLSSEDTLTDALTQAFNEIEGNN